MTNVLITLADCERSVEVNSVVQEYHHLMQVSIIVRPRGSVECDLSLQVAISDIPCTRLEENGIFIPVVPPGQEIVQLLADFR